MIHIHFYIFLYRYFLDMFLVFVPMALAPEVWWTPGWPSWLFAPLIWSGATRTQLWMWCLCLGQQNPPQKNWKKKHHVYTRFLGDVTKKYQNIPKLDPKIGCVKTGRKIPGSHAPVFHLCGGQCCVPDLGPHRHRLPPAHLDWTRSSPQRQQGDSRGWGQNCVGWRYRRVQDR